MTRTQREMVNRMVEALLDVAADRRPAALAALCAGIESAEDVAAVRNEVERLLAEDNAMPARLATLAPTHAATKASTQTSARLAHGSALERVPPIIGRYHIRAPLGKGGMGQVFLADQRAPIRRTVAVKLIRSGFDSHDVIARFEAERQALARMDHPNIARVLDAGMSDGGRPYFAMEYVDGLPITTFADENRLSIRQRLELFAQVCDAVAHAHTKGVIHRDLKPSNVLAFIGEDGKPTAKVIDFGIAKALVGDRGGRLADTTYHTDAGVVIGTYEYMSPEQASMSSDIDTRADVYSLGVLLYEMLTGVRPFERTNETTDADEELRRMIREVEPPRPSSRVRGLSRPTSMSRVGKVDTGPSTQTSEMIARSRHIEPNLLVRTLQKELEWIPLMAMRKDRARRYSGPAELAIDVWNYLEDRPLLAAPESKLYLAKKFIARHSTAIAAAVALVLLLVAGVVGTSVGFLREQSARKLADENGKRATWSAYRSAIVAAEVALQNGDAIRLRQAIEAAPTELRGWEWTSIAHSADTFTSTLRRAEFDQFKVSYALADNHRALSSTADDNGSTVLWDLDTGEILQREPGGMIAVDPAGKFFVIVRPDGALELIDIDTGKPRWRESPSTVTNKRWRISNNSVSLDSKRLLAWDGSVDALSIFEIDSGKRTQLAVGAPIDRLIGFLPIAGEDGSSRVYFGSKNILGQLSIDLDKRVAKRDSTFTIVVGRHAMVNGTGREWLPVSWPNKQVPIFDVPGWSIPEWLSVLLTRRELLAIGREDGSVEIITPRPGTGSLDDRRGRADEAPIARRVLVGAAPVGTLTCTPDEERLIVTLRNGDVCVIPVDPPPTVEVPMNGMTAAIVSPDGESILGFGWGDVQCADTLTGLPRWGRNLGPLQNAHAAWSPDGSTVIVTTDPRAASGKPSDVFVLNGQTGEQLAAWSNSAVTLDPRHPSTAPSWAIDVCGLAFDPTGQTLFVAHSSGNISRVDPKNWTEILGDSAQPVTNNAGDVVIMDAPPSGVLERSPDGRRFAQLSMRSDEAGATRSGSVLVRNSSSGQMLQRIQIDGYGATSFAWNSSGNLLAMSFSNQADGIVLVLDVTTNQERFRVRTNSVPIITALAFSSSSDRVFAFTQSQRMIVFDALGGEEIVSTFTSQIVVKAFSTSDEALAMCGSGFLLKRRESRSPGAEQLAQVLSGWPENLPKPNSVDQARRWIGKFHTTLIAADDSEQTFDAYVEHAIASDDPVKPMLIALRERRPPSINLLNSSALSKMLNADPDPIDLSRAEQMLRKATTIKPHSFSLQGNFGTVLFMEEKFAECVEPLSISQRVLAARGMEQSAANFLRLSIAARRVDDDRAETFFEQATKAIEQQGLANDPEVVPLLRQARELLAK